MTEHALCTRCVSQRNSYAFSRLEEERAMLWTKVFKVEAEPENHEQRKQNWLRHAEQDKMRGDLESRGSLVPTNLLTFIHSSLSISLSGIGRESKLILSVSLVIPTTKTFFFSTLLKRNLSSPGVIIKVCHESQEIRLLIQSHHHLPLRLCLRLPSPPVIKKRQKRDHPTSIHRLILQKSTQRSAIFSPFSSLSFTWNASLLLLTQGISV